jgi:hypothetical protein
MRNQSPRFQGTPDRAALARQSEDIYVASEYGVSRDQDQIEYALRSWRLYNGSREPVTSR